MQIEQLAKILDEMVANAPRGDKVAQIHLFGIKYAAEIGDGANQIVAASSVHDSYAVEVRKGTRLAKYVTVK